MKSELSSDDPLEITDIPRSCPGAPCPMVLASGDGLQLAYYLLEWPAGFSEENKPPWTLGDFDDAPVMVVKFNRAYAHTFGPPNDEAFAGHRLASRGVRPYRVYEVLRSTWIAALEKMNSVHPYHSPEPFQKLKHYIFSFHDDTFECVAESFEYTVQRGDVSNVLVRATSVFD